MKPVHLSTEKLEAALPLVLASPQDLGKVEAIVVRPEEDQRATPEKVHVSPEGGVDGDRWATATASLPSGTAPDPRTQVSLMNARLLRMIAGSEERMALAGDNLIVDLDLSEANLPVGQKLLIGEALLEITDVPHTGCDKFAARFGLDAMRFVNAAERKHLHLRGLYARVLRSGILRSGDTIRKTD